MIEQSRPTFWGLSLMDLLKILTLVIAIVFGYAQINSRLEQVEKNQVERQIQFDKYRDEYEKRRKEDREEYLSRLTEIRIQIEGLRVDIKELWRK